MSELATVQTDLTEQGSTSNVKLDNSNSTASNSTASNSTASNSTASNSTASNSTASSEPTGSVQPIQLPYQASHQVELLHLRAEIDALLQQLQSLKQQRLASDPASEAQDSEIHALV